LHFGAAAAAMTLSTRMTIAMVALVLVTAAALSVLDTLIAWSVAVLGAALLGALFARSLAQPLEQMTAAVQAFGRDEWLIVPADAGGEIGVLARAFEHMARQVRGKTAALRCEVEQRERVAAALRESFARQEAVFASPLIGILTLDEGGRVESLNPEAERIFGRGAAALVGSDVARLIELGGEAETGTAARLHRLLTPDGEPRELTGRHGDGSSFPLECVLAQMPIGPRQLFVMFARNISRRKSSERLKDDFVATVSHELRTPLTSIAGSLGLLVGGAAGKLPAPAARLLSIAYTNSQRLVRLINDILDIEKIESGKAMLDLKPAALRPLIEQAIEANRGFADSFGARIRLLAGGIDATARADADRIIQVMTNLLSNAVKFSPAGAEIEVAIEARGDAVRVAVRDRGPGIPEDFKARIFDKFAQADASDARQKGGTGLGLNIVKQIVTQHGGSVGFEPAADGGTVFHFDLPRVAAGAADSADPQIASPAGAGDGERPRILHVDDDRDVLHLVAETLRGEADTVSAMSLGEARRALTAGDFDLAVLDLTLADGFGLDLLGDLRTRGGAPIPVVVFSAADANPAVAARVEAMLTKSRTSIEGLARVLQRLVADRGAPPAQVRSQEVA
jgi:PAS domain S-box-containing protein